jgi:hypothetical protein
VVVVNPAVQRMAQFGNDLLQNALDQIANSIPIPGVRDSASVTIRAVTAPVVAELERSAQGVGGRLLGMQGVGFVNVAFHKEPEPTTTAISEGPTTPAPPIKPANACAALSASAVATAAGVPLAPGTPIFIEAANECVWELDVNSGDAAVTLWIVDGTSLEQLRANYPSIADPISGLGFPAWGGTSTGDEIDSVLFVDLGAWGFDLAVTAPGDDDAGMRTDLAMVTGLARLVVAP